MLFSVEHQKLYGQENLKVISQIVYDGLKKTKEHIVIREVVLEVGDTLTQAELNVALERSVQNIKNLRLFLNISSEVLPLPENNVMILFTLSERFYTLPAPIFTFEEPNFSTWWKDKDFERTSYGLEIFQRNLRGRNETVVARAKLGFTQSLSFSYHIPYINKNQKLGMSIRTFYKQKDDVVYTTQNNERLFFRDQNQKSKEERFLGMGITFRRALYNFHESNLSYRNIEISDSLRSLNPDYLLNGKTKREYLTLFYRWINSRTDYNAYPLEGRIAEVKITKFGLGLFNADYNLLTLRPTYSHYQKVKDKIWFHTKVAFKYSWFKKLPYNLQEGLGFGETFVRGYEFYIIDGQHYSLLRNNLKFALLTNRKLKIPLVKSEKIKQVPFALYFNFHNDLGYTWDNLSGRNNPLSNRLMRGSGAGMDLVTGYDQVFRFEYSINDRSETGLYFSYRKSI
ncbi:MAG: outer membrane protein assembly factor BamA [Flavobacteriales bacterium]|jgi:outer membrane protein assembly factor BamA